MLRPRNLYVCWALIQSFPGTLFDNQNLILARNRNIEIENFYLYLFNPGKYAKKVQVYLESSLVSKVAGGGTLLTHWWGMWSQQTDWRPYLGKCLRLKWSKNISNWSLEQSNSSSNQVVKRTEEGVPHCVTPGTTTSCVTNHPNNTTHTHYLTVSMSKTSNFLIQLPSSCWLALESF